MGGNVFQGTSDFDNGAIEEILKTVNSSLAGTGIEAIPVGSAATPIPGKTSGDLDVIVDETAVMDYFDVRTPKDARKMLNDYIAQKGFETAQKGVNVHVRAKAGNNSHQVDIMVVPGATSVAQFRTCLPKIRTCFGVRSKGCLPKTKMVKKHNCLQTM